MFASILVTVHFVENGFLRYSALTHKEKKRGQETGMTTTNNSHAVDIGFAFYTANNLNELLDDDVGERFLHKVVECYRKMEYEHIEIWDMERNKSYSIQRDDRGVYEETRTFQREGYTFRLLRVKREQYNAIFQFLRQQVQNKAQYNYWGFFCNFPWYSLFGRPYCSDKKNFFCSELIAYALIEGGVFTEDQITPGVADCDAIFNLLKDSCRTVASSNFGMKSVNASRSKGSLASSLVSINKVNTVHNRFNGGPDEYALSDPYGGGGAVGRRRVDENGDIRDEFDDVLDEYEV